MKRHVLQTILPAILLVAAVFIIGAGCTGPADGQSTFWPDIDGDGYGDAFVGNGTIYDDDNFPDGYVTNRGDCDDTNAAINPGATEIPDNNVDENCNDLFGITIYKDSDNDGFGDPNAGNVFEINFGDPAPNGMVYNNADCDDTNALINPKADEILGNDIDDNCDGYVDIMEYYTDADGDGYGAGSALPPPAVGVHNNLDCDDTNAEVYPYAVEVENGIDDDCDGITDELF